MHQVTNADTDEAIKPIQGYYSPVWKQTLFAIFIVLTLGAGGVLARLFPAVMILLRLQSCPVTKAAFVKFQVHNNRRVLLRMYTAAYGSSTPISGLKQGNGSAQCQLVQLDRYWYSLVQESNMFVKVPRMPGDLPEQMARALPALLAIETGGEWTDFNAVSTWPRRQRFLVYWPNKLHIPYPNLIKLMLTELTNPLILLPMLELGLWMWSFAYYIYPSVLLGIILVGTALSGNLVYQQRKRLTAAFSQVNVAPVVRKGYVHAIRVQQLVPGDVVVVQQALAVCDMVLLRGNCLVDESMLTGEALQTRKIPFVPSHFPGAKYDPHVHRMSTVVAGSSIQQVWNENDEQDECLAMVVRTGLNTSVGKMLRPLVHNKWAQTQSELRTPLGFLRQDVGRFFLLSGLVQLTIYIVLIPSFVRHHVSAKQALLQLMTSVLNSVEPLLPAITVFIKFLCLLRLKRHGILVSHAQKMMTAGHLDVVLFDKTGTLTAEQGRLHGIISCEQGKMAGLKTEAVAWSTDIKKVIALCHDLVPLSKGQVVGRLDEKKAFADVEAAFMGRSTVCLPLRAGRSEAARQVKLEVLHRFDYDAKVMMSGVIAKADSSRSECAQVLIKGAPYEVSQLAEPDSLPHDWGQAVGYWTALGYRVLGIVAGQVLAESKQDLGKLTLQNIRQHTYGMRMLGFAVISNPLRPDSTAAITQLQDRGRLHTIMVTGDHYLTATAVAQATGMLNYKREHILIAQPDAVFIRENTTYLPSVLTLDSSIGMSSQPLDRYGHPLHTKSALPVDLMALADMATGMSSTGSSRSKSLSKLDVAAGRPHLNRVSGSKLSSQPVVPKPALLPHSIPETAEAHVRTPGASASLQGSGQHAAKAVPALLTQAVPGSDQRGGTATSHTFTVSSQAETKQSKPSQMGLASSALVHARSSEPYFFRQLAAYPSSSVNGNTDMDQLLPPDTQPQGLAEDQLAFVVAEGGQLFPMGRKDAFALIAEGHQCIITGPVFEWMLQHAEPSLLDSVLRNVAVCARMRSHQKAQLVQLLGTQGITVSSTRHLKGMGQVVGYCGDGVNDVPALQAADVGLAVGASHAVVAAPVLSLSGSVTAICTLIREARGSLVIAFTLYKYLILLGYVLAIVDAIAQITDRSGFNIVAGSMTTITQHQIDVGLYVSLGVCLGVVCIRPSPQLHSVRPARRLISLTVLGPVALFMAFYAVQQGIAVAILKRQSWYQRDKSQTPVVATVLLIGISQLLAPAISFINDMRPHCLGLRQNALIPAFVGVLTVIGIVWVLYPKGFGGDLLLQKQLPLSFRVVLLCYIAACAGVLAVLVQCMRRLIAYYQARHIRRLLASTYVPMSTEDPVGRTIVGRKSFDGRDALLRSTGSTDVGLWLRRTASAVAELSALLPAYRPSNRVAQDVELPPV